MDSEQFLHKESAMIWIILRKNLWKLGYLLVHKYLVFLECAKYGIYWRGFMHDWSKLSPSEWHGFVLGWDVSDETRLCRLRHLHRSDHHWSWWVLMPDESDELIALPMSDHARKEMLADWKAVQKMNEMRGVGLYDPKNWYLMNKDRIILHKETRNWIEKELGV